MMIPECVVHDVWCEFDRNWFSGLDARARYEHTDPQPYSEKHFLWFRGLQTDIVSQ